MLFVCMLSYTLYLSASQKRLHYIFFYSSTSFRRKWRCCKWKKIYRRVQIRKLYGREIIVEAKEIFIECKSFKCLRQAYFALNFLAIYLFARDALHSIQFFFLLSLHVSNLRNWIIFYAMCWGWNEFIKCALVSRIMTHFSSNGNDLKYVNF